METERLEDLLHAAIVRYTKYIAIGHSELRAKNLAVYDIMEEEVEDTMENEFEYDEYVEVSDNEICWKKRFYVNRNPRAGTPCIHITVDEYGGIGAYKFCRRPRSEIEMDAPIWVRDDSEYWYRRHFAEWADDGRVVVWWGGYTSHTVIDCPHTKSPWDHYSLTDPTK